MLQRILYIDSPNAMKAVKSGDPFKSIAEWMDKLPGSDLDGKTVKSIRHFHIEKRNALVWNAVILVDVE
jgi:hypothetical protein